MKQPAHNGYLKLQSGIVLVAAVVLAAQSTWAVFTPYDQFPAAVCCQNGGLVWDAELQDFMNLGMGKRVIIADFCHSGGFVNDLEASHTYVAAGCKWHELAWTVPSFGRNFMSSSMTNNLRDAFFNARSQVYTNQSPMDGGGQGTLTLSHTAGSQAVIFSAGGSSEFMLEVMNAIDALTNRPSDPWPRNKITALFANGRGWDGAATRANLLTTVSNAAWNIPTDNDKLVLYLDDHGTSTDVVKSRVNGRTFEYETDVSLWRITDEHPYGIWEVNIQLADPDSAHYENILFGRPDWVGEVVNGWMHYHSTNETERTTWLLPGTDYDFSYEYYIDPNIVHSNWKTGSITDTNGGWKFGVNDWGIVDTNNPADLGIGKWVWLQDHEEAVDPELWDGWQNGGDGWVHVPIPEPHPLVLLSSGMLLFALLLRRRQAPRGWRQRQGRSPVRGFGQDTKTP
jgi:hypothetical protein